MGVKCSPTRLLWFVVSFCEPSDVAVMLQGFSILGLVIWVVLFGIWLLIQFLVLWHVRDAFYLC